MPDLAPVLLSSGSTRTQDDAGVPPCAQVHDGRITAPPRRPRSNDTGRRR